ncbi:MAG: hypothetical protein FWE52_01530 [Alphaproteobacteria bacterium]|nr:hypothetical protein [Alphaproteobacteria bacterium]
MKKNIKTFINYKILPLFLFVAPVFTACDKSEEMDFNTELKTRMNRVYTAFPPARQINETVFDNQFKIAEEYLVGTGELPRGEAKDILDSSRVANKMIGAIKNASCKHGYTPQDMQKLNTLDRRAAELVAMSEKYGFCL